MIVFLQSIFSANLHWSVLLIKCRDDLTWRTGFLSETALFCWKPHSSHLEKKTPTSRHRQKTLAAAPHFDFWPWQSLQTGWLVESPVWSLYTYQDTTIRRRSKIVGVVGDVRRDMEGHHYAEKCSVFGISAEELKVLHRSFKCWWVTVDGTLW